MRRCAAFAALLLLGLQRAVAGEELEISARIEPESVAPGDVVTLTVQMGGTGGLGRLDLDATFELENLERLRPVPNRAESFQWVNGKARRTVSLAWPLRAMGEGPARVFNLVARSGDTAVPLAELPLTVSKDAPAPAQQPRRPRDLFEEFFGRGEERPAPARTPKVFVRAEVEPRSVFVGQQALYSLYLYTQADIESVQQESAADLQGFWARDVPRPDKQRPETVDYEGERYARFLLARKAIFPLSAGVKQLGSARVSLAVRAPRAGGLGLIEPTVQARRETNPTSIDVRPLPAAPAGFGGAVGRLRLESRIDPPLVQVGDAATLTLTLTGEGNLQGLRSPTLPALAGLRAFPPHQESFDEIRGAVLRGKRTWKFVLVPEMAGSWNLPPVEIPYFDPFEKGYAVARSESVVLTAPAPLPTAAATPETDAPAASAAATGTAEPATTWRIWLPWSLAAGFAAAFALALSARRPRSADGVLSAAAPAQAIGRRGRPLTAAHRAELHGRIGGARREEHARQTAAAVEEALREGFEASWDLARTTPASHWRARLAERGADAAVLEEIDPLVADLRYLRFAPQLSSPELIKTDLCQRADRLIDACGA